MNKQVEETGNRQPVSQMEQELEALKAENEALKYGIKTLHHALLNKQFEVYTPLRQEVVPVAHINVMFTELQLVLKMSATSDDETQF